MHLLRATQNFLQLDDDLDNVGSFSGSNGVVMQNSFQQSSF